jgi:pimeloyl-ACP methyl ester carboxylesterase
MGIILCKSRLPADRVNGPRRSGQPDLPPAARRRLAALALLLLVSGCCIPLRRLPPTQLPAEPCGAVVFVADGAGNFQASSEALRKAVRKDRPGVQVVTFEWSHGYGRILADQLSFRYAQAQGQRLAAEVQAFAHDHPGVPIYLMGHSAGATVVLSALENLPPGVVERALLLSPSVSARYDVRPALASVNQGVHVYYSQHDYYYLGLATHFLGTADRRFFQPASGRVGFHVNVADPEFFGKLHQRPWQPGDSVTGNLGGHFGNYQPEFLRANVLPLIQPVLASGGRKPPDDPATTSGSSGGLRPPLADRITSSARRR